MGWLLLMGAIVTEVAGTVSLRFADGFSRLLPSLGVVAGYAASFYLLSLTLRHLQLSTSYAVWSAIGTAMIAVIGAIWLGEPLTALKMTGIALVIVGVVVLNLAGGGHSPS